MSNNGDAAREAFLCPRATGGPFAAEALPRNGFPPYESDDAALLDLRDAVGTVMAVTAHFQDGGPRAAKIGGALTAACGALHAIRASYIHIEPSGLHELRDQ